MKRIIYTLCLILALSSCSNQEETPDGYGFLQVSSFGIDTQADVLPLKRSVDNRLQVDICQGASVIRTYDAGAPELDNPIPLPVGSYTLRAHTPGDMYEAADNEAGAPTYSVSTDFNITESNTTAIEPLTARQTNIGVRLQYPEEPFGTAFTKVTCTLTSSSGRTVTIEGIEHPEYTYFNLPPDGKIQYSVYVINTDNEGYTLGPKAFTVQDARNYRITLEWD